MFYVYSIKCLINNKVYIGSTKNYKQRFIQHKTAFDGRTHHNLPLLKDWVKYGEEQFEFSILEIY